LIGKYQEAINIYTELLKSNDSTSYLYDNSIIRAIFDNLDSLSTGKQTAHGVQTTAEIEYKIIPTLILLNRKDKQITKIDITNSHMSTLQI
jgi:hypothetical protein